MKKSRSILLAALLSSIFTGLLIFLLITQLGVKIGGSGNSAEHVLVIALSYREQGTYSFFYDPDGGEVNWEAGGSTSMPKGTLQGEKRMRLSLPDGLISRLRLEFGDRPDTILIRKLEVMTANGNTCTWKGSEFLRFFTQSSEKIASAQAQGSIARVVTSGAAPSMTADPFEIENECERLSAAPTGQRYRWWIISALVFSLLLLAFYRALQQGVSVSDLALVGGFILLLALPLLVQITGAGNTLINAENRALSAAPGIPKTIAQLNNFPDQWSEYFNDHFGGRNEIILWSNLFKVAVLRTTPLDSVVLGKDRWLFYAAERSIVDYQGYVKLDGRQLKRVDAFLRDVRERLDARGIKLLVVVAPDKHSVYPEYLPDTIRNNGNPTRLDQFLERKQPRIDLDVLDLRPVMVTAKEKAPLDIYFKTDSHWNRLGGFYAYQAMIERLAEHYPILVPHALSDYHVDANPIRGRDLARFIMLRSYFTDEEVDLYPIEPQRAVRYPLNYALQPASPAYATEINDPRLPKAVIFHDSFAPYFAPYLSEHFERIVYIRAYVVDWEVIDREKPDVVILQFVERRLDRLEVPQTE
jgi:hypothetical protein